ncbi:maltokinase N-terminal cap-like domain-containing protein [Streptomyces sp. NBC_00344]|uniref:maltokinase N-terminal cap-like domain-containing protein n=1 Tax=Streptomyces sp. NBC_00344 TaxID=2975720 RepID=UPI002E24D75A
MMTSSDTTAATAAAGPVLTDRIAGDLRRLLPGWLGGQRWFAGKGHGAPELDLGPVTVLSPGDPALLQTVVRTGDGERYHLLLGMRELMPAGLEAAVLGRGGDGGAGTPIYYEATQDAELMARLLDRFAAGHTGGPVEFHRTRGADIPRGMSAKPSTAEQSNTSVMFADRMMLKIVRRPVVGTHPELELLTVLGQAPAVPGAAPLAWMETAPDVRDGPMTLAILQEFVPSRGDGWALAVEEATDCLTGDCETVTPLGGFTAEAHRLGRATAEVHLALADRLPTRSLTAAEADALVGSVTARLEAALDEVPALQPYAGQLRALHRDLGESVGRGNPLLTQRIHGDLHLGQALRAESGWVLIDFEGEPGKPPEVRRGLQPALRDVAAMLRSFDYAAHHALAEVLGTPPTGQLPGTPREGGLQRRASAWAVHNRRAFSAGYAAAGGLDPRNRPLLLRAFEADKAVYEAVYEARNRPEWLPIPMAAVRRLARSRRPVL